MRDARAFAAYLNGGELRKEEVRGYKENLIAKGYAVLSVNSMIAALNGFFLLWEEKI